MKIYARVQGGVVAERFSTDADISELFSPRLTWVDITNFPDVKECWTYDGSNFSPPAPAYKEQLTPPTIASLQAQLNALTAQIAALVKAS